MKVIDYYKVLGIPRTASADDVKRAYYKLARKYHPDHTENDSKSLDKFLLIREAYFNLADIDNRIKYKFELENYELIQQQAKIELSKRKGKSS
ncbi:MAG: DnaJ domain-containing protein [Candidatus Kapabacteria bacterium]|nr:DnaJ domain-containing protein [Ignavibacteriota bacterium]MCW5885190.1 DnaJ domain-containing protein [Candidatus Kapabacteria bacterium]